MKKTALALISLTMACAASAQYVTTREIGEANGWTDFTTDRVARMVGIDYNTVKIFNEDFTVAKSFTLSLPESESIFYLDNLTIASQHLFNTDDLYEVVVRSPYGYKVYNEKSEMLGEIPSIGILTIGETNYLYDRDYQTGIYTLYALESHSNNIISVRKIEGVRIQPTAVNHGDRINVELPEGTKADINLYNASGILELRRADASGALELPTDNLTRGVHPYSVTDDDGHTHSGKIIVK